MTIRETCRAAAARLRSAGVPDPEIDSSALMECITGMSALMCRLSDQQLSEAQEAAFEALLCRRMTREPLQYILGEQSFCGRLFQVDERVLIPRPETELLAERAAEALRRFPAPARALDLCCGSGCLGITLALEVPGAQVMLADLSPAALEVSRRNADRLHADVTLHQGDLWAAVQAEKFHLIVSNPPYIPDAECLTLQEEVRQEPSMALKGGADGLDFYRRIAQGLKRHLLPGGRLLLEVGDGQAAAVQALLKAEGADSCCHRDYQQKLRMVEAWLDAE